MTADTITRANQAWDGILSGLKWSSTFITYSFPNSASDYEAGYGTGEPSNNFEALNSVQIAAVNKLLGEIEQFTGLRFSLRTGTSDATATMRFGMSDEADPAWAYYPSSVPTGGDSWYNNSSRDYDNPVLGSYGYNEGFMHEIGHALGLAHGHDSSNPFGALASSRDSNEFSVMTYRDYIGDTPGDGSENETWGNAQSYMMYDIAALQYMYGADYSSSGNAWSGNSVYTFSTTTGEMFINGVGQGTPGGNRIFRTIWDGHGEDTYDLSNYTTGMTIDLRPGEWSTFSQAQLADLDGGSRATNLARGNVANALLHEGNLASLIENAIGGSGNDVIMGNQAANMLTGGGGNDFINGGAGSDKAMFSGAFSEYTLTYNADGTVTIAHTGGTRADGSDTLRDVECAVFADRHVSLSPIRGPLDVVFLQDLTGSFGDDLPNMINAVDDIAVSLQEAFAGSRFAVTSFRDRGDDFVYRVNADFTTSPGALQSTYASLRAGGGGDGPEAQLTALVNAAGGSGLSYAAGNQKIFVLATDSNYHPYESIATVAATLASNGIIPVFAVTDGAASAYETLVAQLGTGVVVEISSNSEDLSDAIRYAIAQINCEVTEAGTSRADTLTGTSGFQDMIFGLGGDDTISGLGGNDTLDGGSGNDRVFGGTENDKVNGGTGHDRLDGNEGDDELTGGTGNDALIGDDITYTGAGLLVDASGADNGTSGGATSVDGLFTESPNADITDATTKPHVTVRGTGDGTVRWYSFTTYSANAEVLIDVDAATFDGYLELYDLSGRRLDWSSGASLDPGSSSTRDPFVRDTLAAPGTYLVKLSGATSTTPITAGATWDLHISVDGIVDAPAVTGTIAGIGPVGASPTAGNDRMFGNDGDDYMHGAGGNDLLGGGAGNDLMYGGDGNDGMDGGDGADRMYGDAGDDVILGEDGSDFMMGGAGADFMRGGRDNDLMGGGTGNDALIGGEGNDGLDGGDGDDQLFGENGDDTLVGDAGSDLIFGGDGRDLILGGLEGDVLRGEGGGDLIGAGDGWDLVEGGEGDDVIEGGDGNDTIRGDGGNDVLRGDGGDDVLEGGAGADDIDGGAGLNTVSYASSDGGVVVDLATRSVGGGHAQGDRLANIAHVVGSAHADRLTGNAGANAINGGAGDDLILGGGDGDVLRGEGGNDLIGGGEGGDFIEGGDGNDGIDAGTGNDVVYGGRGNDTVFGDAGDDRIWGGDDGDRLEGGDGDDLILGEGDGDILLGGAGNDLIGGGEGNDLIVGGTGNDGVEGGDGDDRIFGENGSDTIYGQAGNDLIYGGADNDTLLGGDGNDEILGEDGDDLIGGGVGNDLLVGGIGNDGLDGGDGDDRLFGENGDDVLVGDAGGDYLSGGDGNDVLFGGDGGDILIGGDGNDLIVGGASSDDFYGGLGADVLRFDTLGGVDRVLDFQVGIDKIEVTGTAKSRSQIIADSVTTDGGSTILVLENDTQVVFVGATGITTDWFA